MLERTLQGLDAGPQCPASAATLQRGPRPWRPGGGFASSRTRHRAAPSLQEPSGLLLEPSEEAWRAHAGVRPPHLEPVVAGCLRRVNASLTTSSARSKAPIVVRRARRLDHGAAPFARVILGGGETAGSSRLDAAAASPRAHDVVAGPLRAAAPAEAGELPRPALAERA